MENKMESIHDSEEQWWAPTNKKRGYENGDNGGLLVLGEGSAKWGGEWWPIKRARTSVEMGVAWRVRANESG